MKTIYLFLSIILVSTTLFSQAPQAIPYQAVARNSSGAILANTNISVRFTIRDSIATGAIRYRETHSVTTTAQGLFTANVGGGTSVMGTFSNINWATNSKFLQVEMDPTGGSSYIELGTQQMMSVPYAQYAATSGTALSGTGSSFNHYVGEVWGGGVVFHVFRGSDGLEHGLIVALTDQSTSTIYSNVSSSLIGTSAQNNWNGIQNSNAIISQAGHTNSSAKLCLDLVSGGFSDWYLPSRHELNLLYNAQYNVNAILSTITGSTQLNQYGHYWSSSEYGTNSSWSVSFVNGYANVSTKDIPNYVRGIRKY